MQGTKPLEPPRMPLLGQRFARTPLNLRLQLDPTEVKEEEEEEENAPALAAARHGAAVTPGWWEAVAAGRFSRRGFSKWREGELQIDIDRCALTAGGGSKPS